MSNGTEKNVFNMIAQPPVFIGMSDSSGIDNVFDLKSIQHYCLIKEDDDWLIELSLKSNTNGDTAVILLGKDKQAAAQQYELFKQKVKAGLSHLGGIYL